MTAAVVFFLGRLVHHRGLGRVGLQPACALIVSASESDMADVLGGDRD
jgi:hypothetical protein